MKFKRSPDSYGWTDHTFNRQRKWILGVVSKSSPLKHRLPRKNRRTISRYYKCYDTVNDEVGYVLTPIQSLQSLITKHFPDHSNYHHLILEILK